MISLIWAQTESGVIGKGNILPWNIKAEMQHFISYTKGKDVLMGRNTWESFPKKPLPNRDNYVLTRRELKQKYDRTWVISDLNEIISKYQNIEKELVVLGGRNVYKQTIKYADKLVVSYIKKEYEGDIFAVEIPNLFFVDSKVEFDDFFVVTYKRK